MPTPVDCDQCKRVSIAHFAITQYDRIGDIRMNARVCSIACMVQWAVRFSIYNGQQIVQRLLGGKRK